MLSEVGSSGGMKQKVARIRAILRGRPDSEHEMTVNRLVFATVVLGYLKIATAFGSHQAGSILREIWPVFLGYYAVSLLLFWHIVSHPAASPRRRIFAIFHDIGMISYTAAACGLAGGFMYPLYLWTIFGNGFRFGVRYLKISMYASLAGFAAVAWHLDLLSTHPGIAISLGIGLLLLPLYVSVLIKKLSSAKQQAEEANRAKSLFLASVTHELRTPLNAVIGLSGILRTRPRDREEAEIVRTIERSGRALLAQINSILNLSRIEAGRMPSEATVIDVYALTNDVRMMLSSAAAEKGLRLTAHFAARAPRWIVADGRMLEEVLTNLLANAVKFTRGGFVVVGLDARVAEGTTMLRIDVVDTGVGIAPESHDKIFDSFTQADETVINEFGGSGLGLSICKQLIENAGGAVGVESAKGHGSRFWVELPVSIADREMSPPENLEIVLLSDDPELQARMRAAWPAVLVASDPAAAAVTIDALRPSETGALLFIDEQAHGAEAVAARFQEGGVGLVLLTRTDAALDGPTMSRFGAMLTTDIERGAFVRAVCAAREGGLAGEESEMARGATRLDGVRVLVAEDNRTNQMVIGKILASAGAAATAVGDGEAALDALERESYDVVLMDLNMPRIDGIEAAKLYAVASLGSRRVPIVALTADATEETRRRCRDAGMDAYATKPVEAEDLLRLISEVLAGGASEPHRGTGTHAAAIPASAAPRDRTGATDERTIGSRVLDLETLGQLEALGGAGFADDIVSQFLDDAADLTAALRRGVAEGSAVEVRDALHAFRSCAANAGAERIFELCLAWREIDEDDIRRLGPSLLDELGREIALFRSQYENWRAGAPARGHG